jgi:hypothetical protein
MAQPCRSSSFFMAKFMTAPPQTVHRSSSFFYGKVHDGARLAWLGWARCTADTCGCGGCLVTHHRLPRHNLCSCNSNNIVCFMSKHCCYQLFSIDFTVHCGVDFGRHKLWSGGGNLRLATKQPRSAVDVWASRWSQSRAHGLRWVGASGAVGLIRGCAVHGWCGRVV